MNLLSATLDEIRAKITHYKADGLNEATTKTALINPMLRALGWQVDNPEEVSLEFKLTTKQNPADYALLLAGKPTVLVEAKAFGQGLLGNNAGRWANEVMGYAGADGASWIVLTDGDEYRIYNANVPVPFEQKLFRSVRVSDPATRPEETLLLLSKERINDINEQWQVYFADSRVRAAIKTLFSPPPNPLLISFVNKELKGTLNRGQVRASLARLAASFEQLVVDPAGVEGTDAQPNGGGGPAALNPPAGGDGPYSEFWEPIRRGPGLFAGKPVPLSGDAWISKTIRGTIVTLGLNDHACSVTLQFQGEDKAERRQKALSLFPATKYKYETSESAKCAYVHFPAIDKGRKDREQWPEIRAKLTGLGEEIYNKVAGSDV